MLAHHHRPILSTIYNHFRSIYTTSPIQARGILRSHVSDPKFNVFDKRGLATSISATIKSDVSSNNEEFRTLDIIKSKERRRVGRRVREKREVLPPRYKKMATDQDWPNVWPTARSFHPATVPLPLHQGFVDPHLASPGKVGNAELMKVVNFLHLTPPAIKRQCEALKKFCTPWPEALLEDESVDDYFPVEIITTDYCHSSPIIHDKRARFVTLKVRLSYLNLDEHATDKFRRLVGDRYDAKTDFLTIICENCPLRCQNLDHALYLLTVLYHESLKLDVWEAEKLEEDMEKYIWEGSISHTNITEILSKIVTNAKSKPSYLEPLEGKIVSQENVVVIDPVQQYRNANLAIHNKGETWEAVEDYGKSVRKLFNLSKNV